MSELGGIIRNGIERGWPNDEIKNSLLNSGYSAQEVDYEFSLLLKNSLAPPKTDSIVTKTSQDNSSNIVSPVVMPVPVALTKVPENKFNSQDLSNYQTPPIVEKKASNGTVIAITILLVLCVLAGAGLFLFG